MTSLIKDHWYRPSGDETSGPCGFGECGRAQDEHVESVGEWMVMKKHFFVPHPMAVTFCLRCNKQIGHSVHPLIPKGMRK